MLNGCMVVIAERTILVLFVLLRWVLLHVCVFMDCAIGCSDVVSLVVFCLWLVRCCLSGFYFCGLDTCTFFVLFNDLLCWGFNLS